MIDEAFCIPRLGRREGCVEIWPVQCVCTLLTATKGKLSQRYLLLSPLCIPLCILTCIGTLAGVTKRPPFAHSFVCFVSLLSRIAVWPLRLLIRCRTPTSHLTSADSSHTLRARRLHRSQPGQPRHVNLSCCPASSRAHYPQSLIPRRPYPIAIEQCLCIARRQLRPGLLYQTPGTQRLANRPTARRHSTYKTRDRTRPCAATSRGTGQCARWTQQASVTHDSTACSWRLDNLVNPPPPRHTFSPRRTLSHLDL
jgi:hypothetical protein